MEGDSNSTRKDQKSSPYNLHTIFKVIRNYMTTLCEDQTESKMLVQACNSQQVCLWWFCELLFNITTTIEKINGCLIPEHEKQLEGQELKKQRHQLKIASHYVNNYQRKSRENQKTRKSAVTQKTSRIECFASHQALHNLTACLELRPIKSEDKKKLNGCWCFLLKD